MRRRLILPGYSLKPGPQKLGPEAAHYLRTVLRLGKDDQIELGDGAGGLAEARIVSATKGDVAVDCGAPRILSLPNGTQITLLQAVGKGDRFDVVLRHASQLNVGRFVPVRTARCVTQRSKLDRWRSLVLDGVRLSGRAHLPALDAPKDFADAVTIDATLKLLFTGGGQGLGTLELPATGSVAALVGPEGGLTEEEISTAESAGFIRIGLGPYTLRTETAGIVVSTLLQSMSGGFAP